MTAPSDFLDLPRWEEEGGSVKRLEEHWDEPRQGSAEDAERVRSAPDGEMIRLDEKETD